MLALLLGAGLVNAAQVVLLDKGENYFNVDSAPKSAMDVADMVSRTFYLRALSDGAHTSALKQPRHTPTDNVMLSIYGVDSNSLPCLTTHTVAPLKSGQSGSAGAVLASVFKDEIPEATLLSQEDILDSQVDTSFTEGSKLDLTDLSVQNFLREVNACKKAVDSLGSASSKQPQMSLLQLTTVPTLSETQQREALTVVNKLVEYIIKKMPQDSIGELMFHDKLDLATMALERDSAAFRRLLASNDTNGTNSTGLTYIQAYTNQIFYWFCTAFAIIVYVFAYCFAGMIYDNDKMLYTTFDANFDQKRM